ncbi:MAG TPA: hypothetical protein VMR96_01640, partial [Solirubrobacterales bacterium]|nr:hypothetical protein [Solirubrobacterales bacterium]
MIARFALVLTIVVAGASAMPSGATAFDFLPGSAGFDADSYAATERPAVQAGSHPVALTFNVNFQEGVGPPGEDGLRSLSVEMPPGLIENPTATKQTYCSKKEFETPRISPWEASLSGESCRDKTQIGIVTVRSAAGGGSERSFGLFNLTPHRGEPAELGASPFGKSIVFVPSIRQAEGEYGTTLKAANVSEQLHVSGLTVTIWGVPWSVINNDQRGNCLNELE